MRLSILSLAALLCGCMSEANNWKPYVHLPPPTQVRYCMQMGSKLYDRSTGEECLQKRQRNPR